MLTVLTQGPPFLSGNWASARDASSAFGHAEPFKTVLSGNREAMARLSMRDLEKILAATLTGMSVEEFNAEAKGVFPSVPITGRPARKEPAGLSAAAAVRNRQ